MTFPLARPADSLWSEELFFCVDVKVEQFSDANLHVHFTAGSQEGLARYQLYPDAFVTWRVQLGETWSKRCFLPPFPGSFKGIYEGHPMNPAGVTDVEIRIIAGKDFRRAEITRVYVTDTVPNDVRTDGCAVVDAMGQRIGYEWPTKTHSVEEMAQRLQREYRRAQEHPAARDDMSCWGGYTQKRFAATGWFRTEKEDGRWWLVDPEGYAFFSHGMCYGTRMGEFGWYTGLESLYQDVPSPEDALYGGAFTHPSLIAEYVKRHGTTERSNDWMYNPARANMMRVFGEEWWDAWRTITTDRFHRWGINTMGVGIVNFIDERLEDFLRLSRLPYTVTLKRFPTTKHFIFRDFPDVFSEEYRQNCDTFARNELSPLSRDPALLGYFLHNEPEWMFQTDCNIAYELLVREAPLESRPRLRSWLMERYGSIDALNAAWGTGFADWEVFLQPVSRGIALSEAAWEDLRAYEQVLILAFGQIPLEACRKVDDHHLCLGLRHGRFTEKLVDGSMIFDVFSFNCYKRSAKEMLQMAKRSNKPVLIGEWHFGGQEAGLMRTALLSCETQEQRAQAYRQYMEEAAACPWCVGAHYFEYNDQSLLGRFDGEHMSHGVIDCTNKPYPALAKAIADTSDALYDVHTRAKAPYEGDNIHWLNPHW